MYVCASTRERACRNRMPACTYECACACERVYACTHARGPVFADVCMHVPCVCMRMHLGSVRVADVCMHARMRAHACVCVHACACACVSVRVVWLACDLLRLKDVCVLFDALYTIGVCVYVC